VGTAELADLLADRLNAEIRDLRRLSGGASRQTWSFDAVDDEGSVRELVLQQERPGALPVGGGMATEVAVVQAAARAGVPVPTVVADATGDGSLGAAGMVVERLAGEAIPRRILRDDAFAEARAALVGQCGAALAAVHRIPLDDVPPLTDVDQLEFYRGVMDALGDPHPTLELGFTWLEEHRPVSGERAVVHGDFRLGNLLVGPTGLVAALDWELVHLGDPMEDLAWLAVRAWRFGAPRAVAGMGTRDELAAAYEAAGGPPVDLDAMRWWEILGTVKWGVICMMQASSHLSGANRSVELAAIGRRTCEAEYDLMLLLREMGVGG
jgi:aminoglycoside phosphotransferase (APT) family kinase protein